MVDVVKDRKFIILAKEKVHVKLGIYKKFLNKQDINIKRNMGIN